MFSNLILIHIFYSTIVYESYCGYLFLVINFMRSISLHAKLHSLSYQDNTLITLLLFPRTMVLRPSTTEEQGSPIISEDTIGSSVYAIIPFRFVCEASFKALLTSSLVTSFLSVSTISATEPSLTGTRSAIPSSLPSNSGMTTPIDFAAPVVVGIIDTIAALALLRSL